MSNLSGKSPSRVCDQGAATGVPWFRKAMQRRMLRIAAVVFIGFYWATTARAQVYAGVLGGVSTLSGDARSLLSPGPTAFSSYDPRNGGAVEVLVGRHFSDYFALQANYIWNSNTLTLTAGTFNGTQQAYQ